MEERKIRVGVVQGDINGVGTELILKAFAAPEILDLCTPVVYGSPKAVAFHRNGLQIDLNLNAIQQAKEARDMRVNMLDAVKREVNVDLGTATQEAAEAARLMVDRAVEDCKAGLIDVIVLAPVGSVDDWDAEGTTTTLATYLQKQCGGKEKVLRITLDNGLRAVSAVEGMPMEEVPAAMTKEGIVVKAKQLLHSLKRDLRVENPRVAVLAFNPMNAEGEYGAEEQEYIVPAVKEMVAEGLNVFGPYQADTFFSEAEYDSFDGIVGMCDEQVLSPVEALSVCGTLKLFTGLPLVAVMADEDANYAKAGKVVMDEMAFRHAVFMAIDVCRNQVNYDRPFANPLKKLYHDKKEDGERSRHQSGGRKPADNQRKDGEVVVEGGE